MKYLDRFLQKIRIAKARQFISKGDRVLDIGSENGKLLQALEGYIGKSMGIDPLLPDIIQTEHYVLLPGRFPDALPTSQSEFDVITLLAVMEHIPKEEQQSFVRACKHALRQGGHVIITVPSPKVDTLLRFLLRLRLIEGMSLEEHYGFNPSSLPDLFSMEGFKLIKHSRFEFGLNHLFVFERL